MSGSIHEHVCKDGTISYRVRVDIRTADGRRSQPQRTFATKREARQCLREWLQEIARKAGEEWKPPRPIERPKPRILTPTIYFLAAERTDAIKIGRSTNVPARVRSLQHASPVLLHLLGLLQGDKQQEQALHATFAALHIRGEWFSAAEPLLSYITQHTYAPHAYYYVQSPERAAAIIAAYADVFALAQVRGAEADAHSIQADPRSLCASGPSSVTA